MSALPNLGPASNEPTKPAPVLQTAGAPKYAPELGLSKKANERLGFAIIFFAVFMIGRATANQSLIPSSFTGAMQRFPGPSKGTRATAAIGMTDLVVDINKYLYKEIALNANLRVMNEALVFYSDDDNLLIHGRPDGELTKEQYRRALEKCGGK